MQGRNTEKWRQPGALAAVALAMIAVTTQGATCTWTGSWIDNTPSSATDVIIVSSGGNLTWSNTMPAIVASWTQQAGYSGTVTVQTVYGTTGFTNFTVFGDMTISGGTWTHLGNSNLETYKLDLTVNSNLIIDSNGTINVNGCGYTGAVWGNGYGPGASGSQNGGSYGGVGAFSTVPGGATYGSIIAPTNLGSGGNGTPDRGAGGGGAAILRVIGVITNNGSITSCGNGDWSYGVGSGGSIFITAGGLMGSTSGVISANGGGGLQAWGGGGGRVAVIVTNADANFNGYAGTMTANGTYGAAGAGGYGGAGTIYQETSAQGKGHGTLIIDNANNATTPQVFTLMPAGVNLADFAQIIIRNQGNLAVNTNSILDFSSARIAGQGANNAYITIVSANATSVVFPNPYVISNYTLVADGLRSAVGNWVILTNSSLSHSGNSTSETYKLNLTINGSLTVNSGGSINADSKGYASTAGNGVGHGPGGGANNNGASHGGIGATNTLPASPTYGAILAPTNMGSGGSGTHATGNGGGAVILTVTGALTNNGQISANGGDNWTEGTSAGGSVFITASTLSGTTTGVIRANGGTSGSSGWSGGGGRVAIILTGADFTSWKGANTAYGGTGGKTAAAGTVYREAANVGAGAGTVIVDNNNTTTNATYTPLPAFSNSTENIGKTLWVTTNKVRLGLATNTAIVSLTLNTSGVLELNGKTLTVKALTITNKVYASGIYGPLFTLIPALTDSGSGGKVVITPKGTMFCFR